MLARITGKKAKFVEPLAQLNIELDQRPRYAQTRGSGLAGDPAAVGHNQNVKFAGSFGGEQRLAHRNTQGLGLEIRIERASIDLDLARSRPQKHSGYRRLSPACC